MSSKNCSACNDLLEYGVDFVTNGVNNSVCKSLAANTGVNKNASPQHDDCDDLHDINDCLIGNMGEELDAFGVCDWKEFTESMLDNLYETLKAIICSDCGQWSEIEDIRDALCKLTNQPMRELHMTPTSKVGDNPNQTLRDHWIGIGYYYSPNMCGGGKNVSYSPYWYGKTYNNVSIDDVVATISASEATAVLGQTVMDGIAEKTVTYQSGAIGSNKILFHRLQVNNNQLQIAYVGSTEYSANYTFNHITPTRAVYNVGYFGSSN